MTKMAIWIAVAPLALLVFLLVWRSLAAAPSSLSKESVDASVGTGESGQTLIEPAPWRREVARLRESRFA